jgi:hypothetical protein
MLRYMLYSSERSFVPFPRFYRSLSLELILDGSLATMHLTNRGPIRNGALVASGHAPDAVGAPEAEIEITPEMIEAGARKLTWFDIDNSDHVRIIYEALAAILEAADSGRVICRQKTRHSGMTGKGVVYLPPFEMLFPNH